MTSVTSSSIPKTGTYIRATASGLAGLAVCAFALAFGAGQAPSQSAADAATRPATRPAASVVGAPPVVPPASAPQKAVQAAPTDPAHAQIAFVRGGPAGQYHIWAMRSDGTQQVNLTTVGRPAGDVVDYGPEWSPDGTKIAFYRRAVSVSEPGVSQPKAAAPAAAQDVWVMNADGSGQVNVSAPLRAYADVGTADAYTPIWSADGTRIAFSIQTVLVVFEVANPANHYIISPPANHLNAIEPSFKPDGTKIVYSSSATQYGQGDIVEANVDGTAPRKLTTDVTTGQRRVWNDTATAYSPDGTTVAFTRQQREPDLGGRIATAVVVNAGSPQTIEPATGRDEMNPTWSPDGQQLAVQAYEPGIIVRLDGEKGEGEAAAPNAKAAAAPTNQTDIWKFNRDGTGAINLTSSSTFEGMPAWQPVRKVADLTMSKGSSLEDVIVEAAPQVRKIQKDKQGKLELPRANALEEAEPGDEFTYFLDVFNRGPDPAFNVTVTDQLPAQVELVEASAGCTGTTTVTCRVNSLAAGYYASFTIKVRVKADAGGDAVNTASVTSDTYDPNPGDNSDDATVTILSDADVDIDKRAIQGESDIETAEPGDEFRYLLDVFNSGPATARDVVVTDPLPAQVELVEAGSGCSAGGQTVTCRVDSLAAGEGRTFSISVRVREDARADAVNTATVETASTDPDTSDNSSTNTVRIISDTDVQITKQAEPIPNNTLTARRAAAVQELDQVEPGEFFQYSIALYNAGPATARGVVVTDTLPAEIEPFFFIDDRCDLDGRQLTCTVETIGSEQTDYIRLWVRVVANCGDIVNTASVTSRTPDPNPDNNSSTSSVHISCADLAVEKTDDADPVLLGDQLTYTLTVTNNGTDTAVEAQVVDTVAPNVDIVSVTPADSCGREGQRITCALGDLPAGETRTVTIVVLPREPAELVNTAEVSSPTPDPDVENNTDTETTLVRGTDVAVTVTDDPDPVPYGEVLTYTITVTNNGPQTAGAEVVDTLPAGTTIESVPANCTVNGRVVRCDLGALEPETSTTVEIAIRPFVVGDIVNRTQVLIDIPDSDPSTNQVDTTTTVRGTGLSIRATETPDPIDGNQPLTYDVTVANTGPAASADTVVVIGWNVPPPAATIESTTECAVANRQLRCELGRLAAGDTRRFTVTVVPNRAGQLTTTLSALTSVPDENPDDNQVVLTSTVRPADLVLTQQVTPRPGFVGGIVTYTLTLTNTGTATARDVTLIHRLPKGPNVATVTPSVGTCVVAPVLRCELGNLGPDATAVTVVVKLRPKAAGPIVTSALATTSTTEPDLTDNEVRASTPVLQPTLEVPKVGSPGFTQLAIGRDFPANTDITLRWEGGLNPAAGSTTVRTDANGAFRFRLLVLPRDQIGQREAVAAGPNEDSFAEVREPHLVVPNPVAPRRFISRR